MAKLAANTSLFLTKEVLPLSFLVGLMLLALPNVVPAQTAGTTPPGIAPGAPAGSYSLSGFDVVNLYNGNLNLQLPLLAVVGRGGAPYTMTLRIDQRWRIHKNRVCGGFGCNVIYTAEPNWWAGIRPGYGPGVLLGRPVDYQAHPENCDTFPQSTSLTRLTFISPDGTEHELRDTLTDGQPLSRATCFQNFYPSRGERFVSSDGSAMTFVSDQTISDGASGGGFTPSGFLMFRDGTRYRIDNCLVSWIRDRNGNMLTFEYVNNRVTKVIDSLKREVNISYGSGPGTSDSITYRGFNRELRTIEIRYASLNQVLRDGGSTLTLEQLFPPPVQPGIPTNTPHNPTVVSWVQLPDGVRKYEFFYNPWQELARLVLPTGGKFEYDWAAGPGTISGTNGIIEAPDDQFEGPKLAVIYRRVTKRRVYRENGILEGRENFIAADLADVSVEVERRDPTGQTGTLLAREKHYFYGSPAVSMITGFGENGEPTPIEYASWKEGKEYKTESLDTDTNATLLRRVERDWRQRVPVAWWALTLSPDLAPSKDPRVVETVTRLETDPATQTYLVTKQSSIDPTDPQIIGIDQFNNPTDVWEYDFGVNTTGSQAGPLIRHTKTTYVTQGNYTNPTVGSAHIRNLVDQRSVFDAAEVEQARISYEYDNYAQDTKHAPLKPRPAISGHHSDFTTFLRRGNPTAVKMWLRDGSNWTALSSYQQYDIAGNVVKTIDAKDNPPTLIEYDDHYGIPDGEARDNSQEKPELGSQVTYAFATEITNAVGQKTYVQFDYYVGKPVNTEDADQVITKVEYDDELERATKLVTAVGIGPMERQTLFSYQDDATRTMTIESDQATFNDKVLKSVVLYDGLGRTTETRTYEGLVFIATKRGYDALGRVKRSENPHRLITEETYGWTDTTYDALSRVTMIQSRDKDGNSTGVVTTEHKGNQTTITDQAGKSRKSVTDALGRLKQIIEDPGGALNYQTTYLYDVLDNLIKVTQGQSPQVQTRFFMYDSLSRLIRARNPEQNVNPDLDLADSVTGNGQWCTAYSYDLNGNLETRTDPRRIGTNYAFDALNRPLSRTYSSDPANTPGVYFYYDHQTLPPGHPPVTLGASEGKLIAVLYGNPGTTAGTYVGYDAIGRAAVTIQKTDTYVHETRYEYDLAGELTKQIYPSLKEVVTQYDPAGRIAGVKQGDSYYAGAAPSDSTNRIEYSAHGAVSKMKLGNGLWERTNFNSRLQPKQIGLGTASSGTSVMGLDYTYGVMAGATLDTTKNNGNVESQTINAPGFNVKQSYTYDQVNRLLTAREIQSDVQQWKQTFTYDRFGNRNFDMSNTTPAEVQGPNPTIDLATNRFQSSGGYVYDDAGNLTEDQSAGVNDIEYDAENKQISYTKNGTTKYFYDGAGRRVKKFVVSENKTTIFVYNIADQLIAEYQSEPVTPPQGGGGTSYLTTDYLRSTRIVTTAGPSPTVKARYDYLPFGEQVANSIGNRGNVGGYISSDSTRQKFTQYERDGESQLDYAQARYCSPAQGRFTSVDPFRGSGIASTPQSWNRYTYCLNNPLYYVDPSGLIWLTRDQQNYHWVADDKYNADEWQGYECVEAGTVVYFGEGWGGFEETYENLVGNNVTLNSDGTLSKAPADVVLEANSSQTSDEIGVNPAKLLAATISLANAARLYAGGVKKLYLTVGVVIFAPGPTKAAGGLTLGMGLWNLKSGYTAQQNGRQLWNEAFNEKWSDASWRNLYGPLPYGTRYDDPSEPGARDFWKKKSADWYSKPIEFLSEIGVLAP